MKQEDTGRDIVVNKVLYKKDINFYFFKGIYNLSYSY